MRSIFLPPLFLQWSLWLLGMLVMRTNLLSPPLTDRELLAVQLTDPMNRYFGRRGAIFISAFFAL